VREDASDVSPLGRLPGLEQGDRLEALVRYPVQDEQVDLVVDLPGLEEVVYDADYRSSSVFQMSGPRRQAPASNVSPPFGNGNG